MTNEDLINVTIRIMTVDCLPHEQNTEKELLDSHENFEVIYQTFSGLDALSKIGELNPDVILLNANIEDIDPFELAEAIKKKYGVSKCVFIFLAFFQTDDWIKSFIRVQAKHMLGTPIIPELLYKEIFNAFETLQEIRDDSENKSTNE